jgi:hypothetical protein
MAAPVTTPMTMMPPPAPVTSMPMPMPAVPPVNLLGLEMIDLAFGDERGFRRSATRGCNTLRWPNRRQRRRIRAGSKRRRPCNDSETEFEKFPTFHDVSSFFHMVVNDEEFRCVDMNVR